MKHVRLKNRQTQQVFAALILTGILSLGTGISFVNSASANSTANSQGVAGLKQRNREIPRSVVNAARREISRTYRIPLGRLNVVSYTQQSWSDSCLGLGQPHESCARVLIENGWRVVVSDGRQTWAVRTDGVGDVVRLENQQSPGNPDNPTSDRNIPAAAAKAVLQAASQRTGLPTSQIRIVKSEPMTTDGCLGLPKPGEACIEIALEAWEVTVDAGKQRLVYRTDSNGSRIRLNEQASSIGSTTLPQSVVDAVLREVSQRRDLPTSNVRIVASQQIQGSGSCLGLPALPGEGCTRDLRPLWQVTVEAGQQRLVYHTTMDGSRVRLNEQASSIGDVKAPQSVTNAVLREASQRTGISRSELRIAQSQQFQGSSSCLGIPPGLNQACTADLVPLWQVTVEAGRQRLVYHTNMNGSRIQLNEAASNLSDASLPKGVANAVLQFAARDWGLSSSQLRITRAQKQTWGDSCLGLPRSNERCAGTLTPGWQVMVASGQTVRTYRTDDSGSRIRSEDMAEQQPSDGNLPAAVRRAVLQDAARRSNRSISELRILQAERQDWPNGCLGLAEPGVMCGQAIVPGWRVAVEGDGQFLVYRTNESGSVIKLESGATQGNNGGVAIPQSELPPPLEKGIVFRAIASGGFTGSTTETVLTTDGRVIQRDLNRRNTTPVQLHQISRPELRQFLQLLEQHNFAQFDRLAYPAPRGAADYITVTLTSQSGTTSYVDMGLDRLPEPLQAIAQAWGQIASRR
jgi:uncharacterized protein YcnI